jgi:hypothetical protein
VRALQGILACGQEKHLLESQALTSFLGENQMPVMRRVECAAEKTESVAHNRSALTTRDLASTSIELMHVQTSLDSCGYTTTGRN